MYISLSAMLLWNEKLIPCEQLTIRDKFLVHLTESALSLCINPFSAEIEIFRET